MHHDLAVNDMDNFLSPGTFTAARKSSQFKQDKDQLEKHGRAQTKQRKRILQNIPGSLIQVVTIQGYILGCVMIRTPWL